MDGKKNWLTSPSSSPWSSLDPGQSGFDNKLQNGNFGNPVSQLMSPTDVAYGLGEYNAPSLRGGGSGVPMMGGGIAPNAGGVAAPTGGSAPSAGTGIGPAFTPQVPQYNPGARDVALRQLAVPAAAPAAPAASPPQAGAAGRVRARMAA